MGASTHPTQTCHPVARWVLAAAWPRMILGALFVLALAPNSGRGADVKLDGITIKDATACRDALREFGWFCRQMETPAVNRAIWGPFWSVGWLKVYRHDLDGDGTEDAIVGVFYHCGHTPACPHYFLFGDQPAAEHPHRYYVRAFGPPIVTERDGVRGLLFEATTETGEAFHRIRDVKGMTVSAPNKPIL